MARSFRAGISRQLATPSRQRRLNPRGAARTATYSNLFRFSEPQPQNPMENRKSALQWCALRKKRDTACIGRGPAQSAGLLLAFQLFSLSAFLTGRSLSTEYASTTCQTDSGPKWNKMEHLSRSPSALSIHICHFAFAERTRAPLRVGRSPPSDTFFSYFLLSAFCFLAFPPKGGPLIHKHLEPAHLLPQSPPKHLSPQHLRIQGVPPPRTCAPATYPQPLLTLSHSPRPRVSVSPLTRSPALFKKS